MALRRSIRERSKLLEDRGFDASLQLFSLLLDMFIMENSYQVLGFSYRIDQSGPTVAGRLLLRLDAFLIVYIT